MDPPSMLKSFKYNSTQQQQQPMFPVLETPLHYRSSSSPHTHTHTNATTFQDASFSSYLKPNDKKSQEKIEDTEISIFDAQRYFSEHNTDPKQIMKKQPIPHDMLSVPRLSSVSSTDGYPARNFRTRSFHATPTASSEASWNSQTGLLANPPGAVGVSLRNFHSNDGNRRSSAARKWSFGRKCCCTGKKSVDVKDATTSDSENQANYMCRNYKAKPLSRNCSARKDVVEIIRSVDGFPQADPPRQQRISASGRPFVDGAGSFSFPLLNTNASQVVAKPVLKPIITKPNTLILNPVEEPPRDSLEVFQPVHEAVVPPVLRVVNTDDDVVSDASSDLFEIESFSTQTTSYPMYRRRDSLDEAPGFNARRFGGQYGGRRSVDEPPTPSVAGTECYAPSEVSIDWSVTTAEGFDRASVSNLSEIGRAAFVRQEEEGGKKKGLLMMSCRQEKAVSVGPQPVKCVEGGHVGGRPPRAGKPPLATDHSARLSVAFVA
ncbi:protein PHYTOCHROME KINASE SUBSTRATE 4 [Salvia hispanica]|uniref:protein PHYTOCHROME KINASE SUBSTRATE 4 n=1 Tax=Salvia hispanica TaxID=49212 RepID=UPI00200987BC|nr:protein PHYTOCHROME KINASE SUBSTRATE 4 [Salvia hispanica]